MKPLAYVVCQLLLLTSTSKGQSSSNDEPQGEYHPLSPCPRVFFYENNRTWNTSWFGTIITSVPGNQSFNLTITLNRKADLLGTLVGTVTTMDNENFVLMHPPPNDISDTLTRVTVRIFVGFQLGDPVPRVVSIRRNSLKLCDPSSHSGQAILQQLQFSKVQSTLVSTTRPTRPPTRPTTSINLYTTSLNIQGQSSEFSKQYSSVTPFSPTRPNTRPTVFVQNLPSTSVTTENPWMKHPTTGTLSSESPACGTRDLLSLPFIVNGQSTIRGEWPWHAAIYSSETGDLKYSCGGTLISRRTILTAAHCVSIGANGRERSPDHLIVYLGKHYLTDWSLSEGVQSYRLKRIIQHPTYNAKESKGDIAMIVLEQDVTITSYVRIVCLWQNEEIDIRTIEGEMGVVVGWGFDSNNKATVDLRRANLPVRSFRECISSNREFFSKFLVDKTYCAGYRNGTSACNGDSGGGMVFERNGSWYLRGIVSNGVPMSINHHICDSTQYTIFVDVAQYKSWIEENEPGN